MNTTTMKKSKTILLFNLIIQLVLFHASSASLTAKALSGASKSALTSTSQSKEDYDIRHHMKQDHGEEDQHDEDELNEIQPYLQLMEEDELIEIHRYLNGTAPKHPPKNHNSHSSGGSSGGGSSGGGSSGGGGSGSSSGSSSGGSGSKSSGGGKSSRSSPKKQSSGYMMYGMAAVAVAGVAAVYQNRNREVIVEGEPHALQGSIARRMARFDKMAGKASPEARGSATNGAVQMSSSSFNDGESYGYDDGGDTVYVSMGGNSNISMKSSTAGGNAMAMV